MAGRRKTSFTIELTAEERETLTAWQHSTTIPAGYARRSRIILLLAAGVPIVHIATTVGMSRRCVYIWVRRFQQESIAGLANKAYRDRRAP